jgi:hypothetical protein
MKMDDFRDRRPIRLVFEEVGECNLGSWKRGDGPEIIGGLSDIRIADWESLSLIVTGDGRVQYL